MGLNCFGPIGDLDLQLVLAWWGKYQTNLARCHNLLGLVGVDATGWEFKVIEREKESSRSLEVLLTWT